MDTVLISVTDGGDFKSYDEVLQHIHERQNAAGTVKDTYLEALREREAMYPTGILLDGYSVAIPHCDSTHANTPSVYIIRLPEPVEVGQADGDDKLPVRLVINLVVTNPSNQLQLLKSLFSKLQDKGFYQNLLELPSEKAEALFISEIMQ
ncbi:PTS galactitol transporter subunit IIA [Raoultella ornithinolytica]|jgi:PTS system galactitol-specific IIA component|uniref:PTS galactitol transporter subunit IIA n=1 Tax=Enterobacterales TaxID=91347 RepID=UPI000DE5D3E2|nr:MULTISPECIES: PTS galactitol transporter subunit IIA [Enterobacterales]EKW7117205.1 PTS galactitol transporter subunit IIA [Raoultella ornithinolytica]MCE1517136.1 PTS galactitol transporter subunit IIA [Enterobacter hormaechei]HBR1386631.1 PTS galactitol transporter subunit IIA [Klebsiella quasipneumoniae subsp. similipneumoniae]HCI4279075.1 PTS galactitol transporter subunit IIA [Klebsiella variicola subsp. variicola]HCM9424266.1 PTS galactitol transporter subunit IIA [Enterobacter asburi